MLLLSLPKKIHVNLIIQEWRKRSLHQEKIMTLFSLIINKN